MGLADALGLTAGGIAGLGAMGVGGAIGGIAGAISSSQAANAQQKAAKEARNTIEKYTQQATGYQQPYYDVGTQNLNTVNQRNSQGYYDMPVQNYQQQAFNFQEDPGYQFRQSEGMRGVNANAAAQGMSLSGATQKALQKYGQGLASQEYANAYDRYNTNRNFDYSVFGDAYNRQVQEKNSQWNRGVGLANIGVNAANQLGQYATNAGSQIADTVIGGGNAKASGIMGTGQAIGNIGQNISSAGQIPFYYGGFQQGQQQSQKPMYQPNPYPYAQYNASNQNNGTMRNSDLYGNQG